MKLGFFGANVGGMVSPEATEIAVRAEELGYHSMWTGEHMVLPKPRQDKPPLEPEWPMGDPLVTLAHLAACTERMELCTGILVLPLRGPVQLAKEAATLDVLSGGRLVLGVGAGYVESEFSAVGVPLERRRARFREYIKALRALWVMETPVFDGEFVRFDGIDAYPRPVQAGGPRLVLGGAGPLALKDAAELGAGWYGFGQTPEQVVEARDVMLRHAESLGRDLGDFEIVVTPRMRLDAELVRAYERAGVGQLVVSAEDSSFEGVRKRIELNAPHTLGIE